LMAAMETALQPPVVGDDGALAVSAGVQSGTAAVLGSIGSGRCPRTPTRR
jgi:hypothetical protein